ncbi:pldA [Acrasis kona]|uniref:phospholipase D n=1 Tax=Acrasis kona TaxID=1008807 RepID=A0AAW2Z8D3_9EUKA
MGNKASVADSCNKSSHDIVQEFRQDELSVRNSPRVNVQNGSPILDSPVMRRNSNASENRVEPKSTPRSKNRKSTSSLASTLISTQVDDGIDFQQTHFSNEEFRLLKIVFNKICLEYGPPCEHPDSKLVMTQEMCSKLFFPNDNSNDVDDPTDHAKMIKSAIFRAVVDKEAEREFSYTEILTVDPRNINLDSEVITWKHFIKALSVTCRGDFDEKAKFAFRILDENNNGVLTRQETKLCIQALVDLEILTKLPPNVSEQRQIEDSPVGQTAADVIESKYDEINNAYLQAEKAIDKAKLNRDVLDLVDEFFGTDVQITFTKFHKLSWKVSNLLIDGLGVFDFFFKPLLQPVIDFLLEDPYFCSGRLLQNRDEYFYQIEGGLFRCFTLADHSKEVTTLSMSLSDLSEVRQLHPNDFGPNTFMLRTDRNEIKTYQAPDEHETQNWIFCITMYIIATTNNRHHSFSPERDKTGASWFVDAEDAYRAMASSMLKAHSQIFLTDWCLSPFIYLIRDFDDLRNYNNKRRDDYRLDKILLKKARSGVKISILLWKDTRFTGLNLSSVFTKKYLEGLHSNIKVILHPPKFPIEWSHHQKILVVDQRVAYLGGLDFCFGRFDNKHHVLVDTNRCHLTWPGADYYNPCRPYGDLPKLTNAQSAFFEYTDRETVVRMPWHDVHVCLRGQIVYDVSVNFVNRWNHHLTQTASAVGATQPVIQKTTSELSLSTMNLRSESNSLRSQSEQTPPTHRELSFADVLGINPEEMMNEQENEPVQNRSSLYHRLTLLIRKPKDVLDFMPMVSAANHKKNLIGKIKRRNKSALNSADEWDQSMTTSDVQSLNDEDSSYEQSRLKNFETVDDGTLRAEEEQLYANTPVMSPSYMESSSSVPYGGQNPINLSTSSKTLKYIMKKKLKDMKNHHVQSNKKHVQPEEPQQKVTPQQHLSLCHGQVLRSMGTWSGARKEVSLYNAMLDLINNSRHYIYIENQYFISDTANKNRHLVQNRIGSTLVERIKRAMKTNQVFRVIVVMPVHPEGNLLDAKTSYIMKWQYRTICRGKNSILQQLRASFPDKDPSDYISFYNLRQWGVRNEVVHDAEDNSVVESNYEECEEEHDDEELVTEQIYVHSKIMIVDDLHVVIGSGNINDRSLAGDRDSEIGVLLTDTIYRGDARMNGMKYETCGVFASSLRKKLWREHLGLEANQLPHHSESPEEVFEENKFNKKKKWPSLSNDDATATSFDAHPSHSESSSVGSRAGIKINTSVPPVIGNYVRPKGPSLNDPISDQTYHNLWKRTARENTSIFEEVFEVIPRDNKYDTMKKFEDALEKYRDNYSRLKGKQKARVMHQHKKKLKNIRGTLVDCPLNFLKNEKFSKSGMLAPLTDSIFV